MASLKRRRSSRAVMSPASSESEVSLFSDAPEDEIAEPEPPSETPGVARKKVRLSCLLLSDVSGADDVGRGES